MFSRQLMPPTTLIFMFWQLLKDACGCKFYYNAQHAISFLLGICGYKIPTFFSQWMKAGWISWENLLLEKELVSPSRIDQNGMIICITEKNIPRSPRYSMSSCQFSKLYFHYFLFIPLIRMVGKLMRDILAIQICREALCFFSLLLITILLKDRVRNRGISRESHTGRRVCVGQGRVKGKVVGWVKRTLGSSFKSHT